MAEDTEGWIGIGEAAKVVPYSTQQLSNLCSENKIPHRQYAKGSHLMFVRSELLRWMRGEWDVERGDWKAQEDK